MSEDKLREEFEALLLKQKAAYEHAFEAGLREGMERAAVECDGHAERIKHTSHRDGLGMGDQHSEGVCKTLAAAIREAKP